MRILVTGGAGFVGSHVCTLLLEKGYEIIVLDSYFNSNEKALLRVQDIVKDKQKSNKNVIEVLKGDIRDQEILESLFSESEKLGKPVKAVFHFAGLKSVKESVFNPLLYWDVNVNGALKLLKIMDKYKCRTFVFSSSATIYGLSNDMPILEDAYINPCNPYGNTKAAVEKILSDIYISSSEKWRIANLRYFNPIGAHPSGLIGEDPIGKPNNIFPYITKVAAGNLQELNVFGNDWPTLDGTGVRDYIHIMDLAEGHIAALEYLFEGDPQLINLNLGTGIGSSVLELINTFQTVNSIDIPYQFTSRREGDIATLIADNSLAISCLKWRPKMSLEDMCSDGWRWQSLNPEGYK